MSEFKYVGVDVETCGLNHNSDEIVEICAIEFNKSGEIGQIFHRMCRPMSGFIPAGASKVNNIYYEDVKDAKSYLGDGIREEFAEFLGDRIAVGHNIIAFDSKFLKVEPVAMFDTLLECRKRFTGGNKLKTACTRLNIEWNDNGAHRAQYDTERTIQLCLRLLELNEKDEAKKAETSIFTGVSEKVFENRNFEFMGVIPTDADKAVVSNQAYSYSRINLYNQCPFKWFMSYARGMKQPQVDYLTTGSICHKIAELVGQWCYRELFLNKFEVYFSDAVRSKELKFDKASLIQYAKVKDDSELTYRHLAGYLYDKRTTAQTVLGMAGIAPLITRMDAELDANSYEIPSMPDEETYWDIVMKTINNFQCNDVDVIRDVKRIMSTFYMNKDFSVRPNGVMVFEKKIAVDKDWNIVSDFFGKNVFFRFVVDVVEYIDGVVTIVDYKSSRKAMKVEDLKEDRQLKCYVLAISKMLPKGSFHKVVIRIDYLRHGETIEVEFDNVDHIIKETIDWIEQSVQSAKDESLKTDGKSFMPRRNEFCHVCHVGEVGVCPLFNKQFINNMDDPMSFTISTIDDCQRAWKRVEANKNENARLTKLCKAFVERCESDVYIDDNARLDFHLSEGRDYDSGKTMMALFKKGIPVEYAIKFFSMTQSSMESLKEAKGIEFTVEEIDEISKRTTKNTFNAYTRKEIEDKGFINK